MFCKRLRHFGPLMFAAVCAVSGGCAEWYATDADGEVYGLIDQRQQQAVGIRADADVGKPKGPPRVGSEGYAFVPHPVDPAVPESFTRRARGADTRPVAETQAASAPAETSEALVMGFEEVVKYAFRHARDFQDHKEELYLTALGLTLERHLWTPQLIAEIQSNFADYGQIRDFDRAMDTIADVSVSQRLPLGGTVTAEIISTFMRDLGRHITSGESSQLILSAEIP